MIKVTRLDGKLIFLNAEWIQTVENTPDTMITLTNGQKFLVKETLEEVVSRYKSYKRDMQEPLFGVKR